MNPETLLIWSREPERRPFDTEAWNRFMNFMNGVQAGPAHWRALSEAVGLRWSPENALMQSQVEWELQLAGNVYDAGNRAVLKLGARAGSQAVNRDTVIWLANENSGTAYRFQNFLLVSDANQALDATTGVLIRYSGITSSKLIDASSATFLDEIVRLPGISGQPGLDIDSVSGTTGLRILADLINATRKSRFAFQAANANSAAVLSVLPSGTGTSGNLAAYNNSDPDLASVEAAIGAAATSMQVRANSPSGSFQPLQFFTSNTKRGEFLADGTFVVAIALRLANAIWLVGRNAAGSADVNLIRVNASDVIELGAAANGLTVVSGLTNNTFLQGRESGGTLRNLVGLNGSNQLVLGNGTSHLSLASPIINNTALLGRNAANSANITVVGVGSDDRVKLSNTGQTADLLGTTVAAANDPPTAEGEVTRGSQAKVYCYYDVAGAALGDSYNISGVVRNLAGDFTVSFDRDFAAATYAVLVTVQDNAANLIWRVNGQAVGSCDVHFRTTAGVLTDPDAFAVLAFGVLS